MAAACDAKESLSIRRVIHGNTDMRVAQALELLADITSIDAKQQNGSFFRSLGHPLPRFTVVEARGAYVVSNAFAFGSCLQHAPPRRFFRALF